MSSRETVSEGNIPRIAEARAKDGPAGGGPAADPAS
jgi:hypothetical protein